METLLKSAPPEEHSAENDAPSSKPSLHGRHTKPSTGSRSSRNCSSHPSHDSLNGPWPVHPVSALRGAFEESIEEAMDQDHKVTSRLNAATRRLQLLQLDDDDLFGEGHSARWRRQKPGAKYHPLWKLIAQISFGVHLLHKKIAKSEDEVIKILQTHIDDIDAFLEDTNLDFDLAVKDIEERTELLCIPLDNGKVFDRMLRSKSFRSAILEGNDIIEKIIQRTNRAMSRSLDDGQYCRVRVSAFTNISQVKSGLEATAEFAKFLDRLGNEWTSKDEEIKGVYDAMQGNAEGWYCCFENLQEKGDYLQKILIRLDTLVGDVARRAGIASRRKTVCTRSPPLSRSPSDV